LQYLLRIFGRLRIRLESAPEAEAQFYILAATMSGEKNKVQSITETYIFCWVRGKSLEGNTLLLLGR
jgi:hypothetical protein